MQYESKWQEANMRLDRTRIYIVGWNELTEMMSALYLAAERALSISHYDIAFPVIALMEEEGKALEENPAIYGEQIEARKKEYQYGEDFSDGDNQVSPRYKPEYWK
jgi:hypothetical protein